MKANLKGLGGIKGVFLLHGEKLAIAAVGICALMIVWYSLQLDHLEDKYQADKLRAQISQTEGVVRDFSWEKAMAEHPAEVRVAKELGKGAAPEVDPKQYPFGGIDPPVIKSTTPRTDPVLLAAVDPRATGGSGLLPFLDDKVLRERQLKRAAEEEQKAKAEAAKLEKEQKLQAEGRDQGQRGRGRGEEGQTQVYDPDHPDRRPIENVSSAPGAPAMGDERIEKAFWAIVVAKVPIKEQLKLYRDAFENTRAGFNPEFDFPHYIGYFVERAEVRPGQPLKWEPVSVMDGQGNKVGAFVSEGVMAKLYTAITKFWAVQMPELVDPRYLDPSSLLAFPLPPLLGREWGPEVTHPDIPLAINAPPPEEEVVPEPETTPAQGAETDDFSHPVDAGLGGIRRPGGEGMGGRGGYRGSSDGEGGGRGGYGRPSMGGRRSMGGEDGGRGGPGMYRGGAGGVTAGTLPKNVDSWLLRFIDFSVEPGKKYKYRVRLVMDDANSTVLNPQLLTSTLDSSVLNRQREAGKTRPDKKAPTYRLTDWSEPTPTVGIPLSGSLRLASVKVPSGKSFNDEPAAELLVEAFDLDEEGNAIHAANPKELRRGYVANMVEDTEYITPDGKSIDKKGAFKFFTGITLVDVAGGEKLTKDLQAPSRVLLLDPAGELYIRSETEDAAIVHLHKLMFAKPDRRNREGDGGRGDGGRGGGRGGRDG